MATAAPVPSVLLDARHPVAFFANGLGDHLLSLPALRALATLFPRRLRLVCLHGKRDLFFADVRLQAHYETEIVIANNSGRFDERALAGRIGMCDLFISLVPWHSPSMDGLLALLAPCHTKGFFAGFTDTCRLDYGVHSADLAFSLPRRIDPTLRIDGFWAPPQWPAAARSEAARIRAEVPAGMRLVVVHADSRAEKMWPAEKWSSFLDVILGRFGHLLVLVVGRTPMPLAPARHRHRIAQRYGLSLETALAIVGQADLFVGIDSCMLHAADFCRVPGLGLFGPTDPREFGFRFARHRHLAGEGSLESIAVEDAVGAFDELVNEIEGERAASLAAEIARRK